jgi:ribonuclease BN (tRNA processing enzyme)
MRLTIAGCGTAAPDPERAASGYFLETGGLTLLMDCGPGVLHHMARFGLDWQGITHLLITHFHNDHTGDVPALLVAWRWGMLPPRSAPLHIIGPRGLKKRLRQMAHAMDSNVDDPGFDIRVHEMRGEDERLLNDVVHLRALRTPHTDNSIAFRIDSPDGSIGYTGDTGYSERVSTFLSRVELLIMECSLPDEYAMDTHLTPARAARMAQQANPGALVLTHVYPQLDRDTLAERVRDSGWAGDVVIAHDGMTIDGG